MLYFAYGSNLNWYQMKGARCRGSIFLQTYILKGYKLIFSHRNPNNKYGHANIEKNRDFKVPGAIWKITKNHENVLDEYEAVNFNPPSYQKRYLPWKGKKVLVYAQNPYTKRKPSSSYLHTIIQGYKDCGLDLDYLKRRITFYKIDYDIKW